MITSVFALLAAFFIGLNNVLIRKGMDYGTRGQAIFVSLFFSVIVFWLLLLSFVGLQSLFSVSLLWFLLAGLFGPSLGRALNFTSLQRIGVARTIPIVGAAPLFSVLIAIVFLGEEFSWIVLAGTAVIVFGIYLLSRGKNQKGEGFTRKELLFPLGSALCFGITVPLIKKGLSYVENPIIGAAFTATTALLIIFLYLLVTGRAGNMRTPRTALILYFLAGLSTVAAFLFNFSALNSGSVSLVAPLMGTFPLFGVLLSGVFLKEKITKSIYLGAIFIFLGIVLVNI
ncbi:MAG: DMT family transporter [bacterium]